MEPEYIHFSKRCTSITSKSSTKVQIIHFMDGTTAEADIVVVANGIKSSVRDSLMLKAIDGASVKPSKGASYSNTVCYRGLVRRDHSEALGVDTSMWHRPMLLMAKDKVRPPPSSKNSLIYDFNCACSTSSSIPYTRGKLYVHDLTQRCFVNVFGRS